MIEMLEKHYDKKVILYATQEAYDLYIKDAYPNVIYGFVVFLQNRVYLMRENGRLAIHEPREIKRL